MCELARNSIMQSGWELQIKKQWLGPPLHPVPLIEGDDLETVANTNVPAGRLAFRREVLNEEKRLMMLSTRGQSRRNTSEEWVWDVTPVRGFSPGDLGLDRVNGTVNGD
jgi:AMP deaminase